MGTIHHHAIIVTSFDKVKLTAAYIKAGGLFPWVSALSPEVVNGYRSFFIPPDGSKEGWHPSDEGDERRQEFIEWLNTCAYDDGSSALTWIEVGFGEYGYEVENSDDHSYLEAQAAEEQAVTDEEAQAYDLLV